MKAKIEINFKKIGSKKVEKKLFKEIPQLKNQTEKTIKSLCKDMEAFFKSKKIKAKVNFIDLEV